MKLAVPYNFASGVVYPIQELEDGKNYFLETDAITLAQKPLASKFHNNACSVVYADFDTNSSFMRWLHDEFEENVKAQIMEHIPDAEFQPLVNANRVAFTVEATVEVINVADDRRMDILKLNQGAVVKMGVWMKHLWYKDNKVKVTMHAIRIEVLDNPDKKTTLIKAVKSAKRKFT